MRDVETIIRACIDVAKSIGAPIICLSDLPVETDDVPVIIAANNMLNVDTLFSPVGSSSEGEQILRISSRVASEGETAEKQVSDAGVTSFIRGVLDGGVVVGLVELPDAISIVVHDLDENPVMKEIMDCGDRVDIRLLVSVLNIAFDIASFGMEGVSIGCAFIIGDVEEVMHRSHQLVLNPYYGHRREERDVLDPSTWETVKEFAQLDGVIVIDDEGIVVAAGRYLDVDASEISIKQGLGARHAAVAAITRDTQAVGVAVSQTGGTIRIFKDGIAVVEIDPTTKITGVRGIGVK